MITLVIEASTYVGSAALFRDGHLVGDRTIAMRGREHEALMPAVASLLIDAELEARVLGRIVCGEGPGAFTSLRIAGGIAKGLALASAAPIVPVSSLALIVGARPLPAGSYLAVLAAMRGEHYARAFHVGVDGVIAAGGPLALVRSDDLQTFAGPATIVGPGQAGDRSIDPHARGAGRLTNMISSASAADLASWEPVYGRLAEAQVKWEAEHGRPLVVA